MAGALSSSPGREELTYSEFINCFGQSKLLTQLFVKGYLKKRFVVVVNRMPTMIVWGRYLEQDSREQNVLQR